MNSKRIAGYRRYTDMKQILVNSHGGFRGIRSHRDPWKEEEALRLFHDPGIFLSKIGYVASLKPWTVLFLKKWKITNNSKNLQK
jgi:hypothetical protein